ncbi:hypothetical protein LZ554_009576 [Drepanopeziza brunnea f. sp. 'monogermtubi']|nr:hypothetical protein LZ554_009576 [Drepanopeziza brunnea f. sp. 'monogermtubi']
MSLFTFTKVSKAKYTTAFAGPNRFRPSEVSKFLRLIKKRLLSNLIRTEPNRILRRGIQYGPEVTDEEIASDANSEDPSLERGLLFVCYQSSFKNGFQTL